MQPCQKLLENMSLRKMSCLPLNRFIGCSALVSAANISVLYGKLTEGGVRVVQQELS